MGANGQFPLARHDVTARGVEGFGLGWRVFRTDVKPGGRWGSGGFAVGPGLGPA